MCQIAVDNGATTLNIPDTVGYGVPEEFAPADPPRASTTCEGEFVVSTHCHNDLGLAVANSLAGVGAGARQVECAVNGLGERAGNAALEEVVMAIRTRSDYFGAVETTVRTEELARTSRMVARLTGYPVQYNKAIVGRNAFAHESGIHQHGVLEDRETYEIIDASTVGQEAAQIVLGKHSGRHAFADSLEKMGLHVQGDALNQAFTRFKELADRKVEITEADLEAIVAEELGVGIVHRFSIVSLELRGGTQAMPSASVVLADGDGRKVEADGSGNGMIDAAVDAISRATGVSGTVLDFKVSSVTGVATRSATSCSSSRPTASRRRAAACRPTWSRRRHGRTSRRSTRSCGCASVPNQRASGRKSVRDRAAATASGPARRRNGPAAVAPSTGSVAVACPRRAPTPLIQGTDITKQFGSFVAVDGIDFHVEPGEAFGFLGPNGAGKTSTMRMIGCVSPVTSGELARARPRRRESTGRRSAAGSVSVPQEDSLDTELTVYDNLLIYGRYFDLPARRDPRAGPTSCSSSCSSPTGATTASTRCRAG